MTISAHDAPVLVALLAIVTGALVCALVLRVAYPILLVLAGIALALIPGLPHPELNPKIVLFGILPPLLYSTAYYTSVRELRLRSARSRRSRSRLVFAPWGRSLSSRTHLFRTCPGRPRSYSGRSSRTDPGGIADREPDRPSAPPHGGDRGRGPPNDATALVVYRFAVVAAVTGSFSIGHGTWKFSSRFSAGSLSGSVSGS